MLNQKKKKITKFEGTKKARRQKKGKKGKRGDGASSAILENRIVLACPDNREKGTVREKRNSRLRRKGKKTFPLATNPRKKKGPEEKEAGKKFAAYANRKKKGKRERRLTESLTKEPGRADWEKKNRGDVWWASAVPPRKEGGGRGWHPSIPKEGRQKKKKRREVKTGSTIPGKRKKGAGWAPRKERRRGAEGGG